MIIIWFSNIFFLYSISNFQDQPTLKIIVRSHFCKVAKSAVEEILIFPTVHNNTWNHLRAKLTRAL